MKKRYKFLFWTLSLLIVAAIIIMPGMVQSSIPTVYYVTPSLKTYENTINCAGTIQSGLVQSVYLDSAIVPEAVLVEVGDRVSEGDVLFTVDAERTSQLSSPALDLLRGFSDEAAASTVQNDISDWEAIAAAYGLNATVLDSGSTSSLYSKEILNLLEEMGILSAQETERMIVSATASGAVTAPIAGVVTDVMITEQTPASSGKALVTIADDKQYKVMATVGEADIAQVRVSDSATVRGVGFGGSIYSGEVIKVYPTARKALSGTSTETVVDVEILLHNPDKNLKPGFTAKVEISGGEDYNLLTVPYEAIRQDENNNEYVYTYVDGKLQKSVIVTGKEMTNEVQVLDGLEADSIVIYNPSDVTREGMMIHIKGRADVD